MDQNKNNNEKKVKNKKRFRWLKLVFLSVSLLFLSSVLVLTVLYAPKLVSYAKEAKATVDASSSEDFRKDNNSYIYDDTGNQLAKLYSDRDVKYVKYDDLPEGILDAFVAIEDKRFYNHKGVDWLSTSKAFFLLITNKGEITRGGSTITQQLARNVFLSFETSYERKAKEIFLAIYLEKKYSKNEILEFYINNINYANGYYGIGAAAQGYFGKDVDELEIQEIAFLCAIPNNPTYYNPRQNFSNTITRRNTILKEMYDQNFLSDSQYQAAVNSEITLVAQQEEFYNYESSYAIHAAVLAFMRMQGFEFQYSYETMDAYQEYRNDYEEAYGEAKQLLCTGGYKINTSINQEAQQNAQKAVDETLADLEERTEEGEYLYQGACTVIDNETGLVIAIVGGRSQDTNGIRTLNRAYQSNKQPGSTIKPLAVYTPALESGYTADTMVTDQAISNGPSNADGKYLGRMTMRRAVEKSRNTVAWSLMDQLTPEYCLSYIQDMQFGKIVPDDYYDSAALGGLTYGVTTVEMASGYCTLANSGIYQEPTCITGILDADGNEVYSSGTPKRVYDENAANWMTDILTGVATDGTAKGLTVGDGMPVACKTGTTNNQTCGWFCGYTPYYTVAVYVGADMNIALNNLWGSTYPCAIWKAIQEYLCQDKEIIAFHAPEDVVTVSQEDDKKEKDTEIVDEGTEMEKGKKKEIPVMAPEKNTQEDSEEEKESDNPDENKPKKDENNETNITEKEVPPETEKQQEDSDYNDEKPGTTETNDTIDQT